MAMAMKMDHQVQVVGEKNLSLSSLDSLGNAFDIKEKIAMIDRHMEEITGIFVDSLEDQGKGMKCKPGEISVSKEEWEGIRAKLEFERNALEDCRKKLISLECFIPEKKKDLAEKIQQVERKFKNYKNGIDSSMGILNLKADSQKKRRGLTSAIENLTNDLFEIQLKNKLLENGHDQIKEKIQSHQEKLQKKEEALHIYIKVSKWLNYPVPVPANCHLKPYCTDEDKVKA